ncbi:hypothetical protein [Natronococcus pandeyae]|uniref:hypothetical protein n=1 Tax=Natronococcus pandeyae TaxID=2055836 RepID=UPI0016530C28|nr:hypothetical protein [Natronococcus pandeyae]
MNQRTVLLAVAFGLAGFSAIVHLVLGVGGILESLANGTTVLLPILFLIGAAFVVALGVSYATGVVAPPTVFLAGALLMIGHVFAYADWHVFQIAESTLGFDGHDHGHDDHGHDDSTGHDDGHDDDHSHDDDHAHDDHSHDDGHDDHAHDDEHSHDDGHDHDHDAPAHEVLVDHLRDDLAALSTKIAEIVSATAFVTLYLLER